MIFFETESGLLGVRKKDVVLIEENIGKVTLFISLTNGVVRQYTLKNAVFSKILDAINQK